MNIGRLRNKGTIVRRQNTKDGYGEKNHALVDVVESFFDISELKTPSSENETDSSIEYVAEYRVFARYNTKIKNGDYLEIDQMFHRISGVIHDLRKRRFTKFNAVYVEGIV